MRKPIAVPLDSEDRFKFLEECERLGYDYGLNYEPKGIGEKPYDDLMSLMEKYELSDFGRSRSEIMVFFGKMAEAFHIAEYKARGIHGYGTSDGKDYGSGNGQS